MPLHEINDFSGGKTDNYLESDPKSCKKADNLLIDEHRELYQRPGLCQFADIIKQLPAGNQRVDGHYYFDSTLFVKSGTRLYYWEDGDAAWTTLDGPNAHAFADSSIGTSVSWSEWRGHLFITAGPTSVLKAGSRTVKVYRNTSSVWTLRQAGLPDIADVSKNAPIVDLDATAGTSNFGAYQWWMCYVHEYTAKVDGNNVTFKDFGKPELVRSRSEQDIYNSGNYVIYRMTASNLHFANGTYENYPTTTLKVAYYRTKLNQTIPLLAGEFTQHPAGTAGNTDVTDEGVLDDDLGEPLYIGDTLSPVLDNDPVPKSFFSEMVDTRMGYFGTEDVDSAEFNFDTYRESKPDDPDSVPAGNFVRVEGKASGLAHVGVYPICFTFNKSHRIEGHFDLFGGGSMRARLISESEGCVSHKGIIRTKDFVLFPSKNGFCWTDGFTVINLTETHLRASYAALLNKGNITGAYHAKERRVYWAVESADCSPSNVNNELWIMDTRWSTPERAVFTTASMTADNLQANSLYYDRESQTLLIGDQRGYVLNLDPYAVTDLTVVSGTDVDDFAHQAIVPHYVSSALRGPSTKFSIWVSQIFCIFKNLTGSLYAAFEGYDDDKSAGYSLRDHRRTGASGLHRVKRWWRRGSIESAYKLIGVTKPTVNIVWSDVYGTATVSGSTATIDAGTWPDFQDYDLVGYVIYFGGGATGYTIETQSGANLALSGSPGDGAALSWEIKGVPKNSSLHIKSVNVEHEIVGETYVQHRSGDDGGNA